MKLIFFSIFSSLLFLTTQTSLKNFHSNIQTTKLADEFKGMFRPNAFAHKVQTFSLDQQNLRTMDLSNYTTIIGLVPFYGNWINDINSNNVFDAFSSNQGFMSVESPDFELTDTDIFHVDLWVYEGQYIDQKFVQINVEEDAGNLIFNPSNASIVGERVNLTVKSGYNKESTESKSCLSDFSIYFIDLKTAQPFTTVDNKHISDLGLEITFQSAECNISLHSQILKSSDVSYQELLAYMVTLVFSAGVGMYSSNKLLLNFPENMAKLAKISLWSIWLINAWDFYLFLYHIVLSVMISGWLMVVALSFFALSIMTETKLVYVIYMSSYRTNGRPNISSGCKFFGLYYGLLYLLVFSYTYITSYIWVILTSCLYIVPQIALVYSRGKKYRFNFWHILGLSVTRIAFVSYIKLYPTNIFRLFPDVEFASVYCGIIFLQILILFFQRFFPKFCFTPTPFKYFVSITQADEKEEICPICMELLKEESVNAAKPLLENEKAVTVMQTPCKHRFHEGCLSVWMKNKLECPSCRQTIPSLNNEDLE